MRAVVGMAFFAIGLFIWGVSQLTPVGIPQPWPAIWAIITAVLLFPWEAALGR